MVHNLINFYSFTIFSEYFIGVCIIYAMIVIVLVSYNIYGLIIQKAFGDCISIILLMTTYLIFNDDLLMFNFSSFNGSLINDYFSFFTKILISLFSVLYFFVISSFLKKQKLVAFEYLLLLLFAILGFLLMCSSNDLLMSYLAIELSSLSLYILASFQKLSIYSVESGIKYFIVGAISSAFFLLGSSFMYGIAGSVSFLDFQNLFNCFSGYFLTNDLFFNYWHINFIKLSKTTYFLTLLNFNKNTLFNYNFIEIGLVLILFSLFIKLALVPFHLWSLDVYEGSPTTSTFFFAVITKLSIFVLLIRICYQSFFCLKNCWQIYFFWVSIFSIFVGSFGGLLQRKLKTLLAYSSISHMGYVLIPLSTNTFLGIQMLLFYLFIYMISGLCFWYIILLVKLKKNKFKYTKELNDLLLLKKSNPALAFSLALTMFSISGIPPMVGFIAKMNIFLSIIGISFYFTALLIVICSVVSTFYYIRMIKILYFENFIIGQLYYPIKNKKIVILTILNFLLIYFFLNPTILYLINYKIILYLF